MLIGEALTQAASRLRNDGVDSPRLDAELLLAHVLDANRAKVLTWPERRLTPKQLTRYRDLVARRAAREPLAYIIGRREFFGLDFVVDPRVLIPRPETELLVERALSIAWELRPALWPGTGSTASACALRGGHRLGSGISETSLGTPQAREAVSPQLEIADVGAGSGAIAVTLAVHLPEATLYALDDSEGTLAVTAENARRHGVSDRVHCLQGDLLGPLPAPVELITANLPYVTTGEWQGLPPEIRNFEPHAALDGGPDGLTFIRRLLALAGPYLRPGGSILLEIGASQAAAVTALARHSFPQARVQHHQDYAGLDRLVVLTT